MNTKLIYMIFIFTGLFYLMSCVKDPIVVDTGSEEPNGTEYLFDDAVPGFSPGDTPDFNSFPLAMAHKHSLKIRGRWHRQGYKTPYKNMPTIDGFGTGNNCNNTATGCYCCHALGSGVANELVGGLPYGPPNTCGRCHTGIPNRAIRGAPSCYSCHNRRWSECDRPGTNPITGTAYPVCP